MTTRVFDCNRPPVSPRPAPPAPVGGTARGSGFKFAVLTAALVVPLAGAAEPPQGWAVAALTALALLILARVVGGRAHWGWLTILFSVAAIVTPRGQLGGLGPALFVATGLCLVLWFASRGPSRPGDGRVRPDTGEREAQLLMGMSGERHVAR